MAKLAVHYDWLDEFAVQAPAGIWNEHGESFYFPATVPMRDRAEERISGPPDRAWDQRLDVLTDTVSTYGPNWMVVESAHPLPLVLEAVRRDFLQTDPPTTPLKLTHPSTRATEENFDRPEVPFGLVEPAPRFHIEQSWWIASEIVRRNPDRTLYEMHPGGGLGDELAVVPARELREGDRRIRINRGGTIRVDVHHDDNSHEDIAVATSAQMLGAENPHEVVKILESAARINPVRKARPGTPRSLAFRFVSTALTMLLNDRHRWDCRSIVRDSSGDDAGVLPHLARFPLAQRDSGDLQLEGWEYGRVEAHYWALLRGAEPICLVSTEGRLYRGDSVLDLSDDIESNGRPMLTLVCHVLGDLLP